MFIEEIEDINKYFFDNKYIIPQITFDYIINLLGQFQSKTKNLTMHQIFPAQIYNKNFINTHSELDNFFLLKLMYSIEKNIYNDNLVLPWDMKLDTFFNKFIKKKISITIKNNTEILVIDNIDKDQFIFLVICSYISNKLTKNKFNLKLFGKKVKLEKYLNENNECFRFGNYSIKLKNSYTKIYFNNLKVFDLIDILKNKFEFNFFDYFEDYYEFFKKKE